ncbi:MAG: BON domain-containing protein [Pseudomonadota bacterium]|nr:BON domain-containing protein [Pseudomonadota bacterium]
MGSSEDQVLAARVEARLRADPAFENAPDLTVRVTEGAVTLSGLVENTAQAKRAVQVVESVEGVKGVEDKLVRESKTGMPATPHQSDTIDAPALEGGARRLPISHAPGKSGSNRTTFIIC